MLSPYIFTLPSHAVSADDAPNTRNAAATRDRDRERKWQRRCAI